MKTFESEVSFFLNTPPRKIVLEYPLPRKLGPQISVLELIIISFIYFIIYLFIEAVIAQSV